MNEYFEQLCKAMTLISEQPHAIFMGQSCREKGTAMFTTLRDVPMEKRLELPVFENSQCGMAIGVALAGGLPISLYPRINFLLEALPQLVQHLDKIPLFSDYKPRVIIRTSIATTDPLDPGPQHIGNYTDAIEAMLSTVKVVRLTSTEMIVPEYQAAMERDGSTLLVEWVSLYHL